MKIGLVITICASLMACTGPSNTKRANGANALTERQIDEIPQSDQPGIHISGSASIGVSLKK